MSSVNPLFGGQWVSLLFFLYNNSLTDELKKAGVVVNSTGQQTSSLLNADEQVEVKEIERVVCQTGNQGECSKTQYSSLQ